MSPEPGGRILAFHSVHEALVAERLLAALGLACELIPVPRELSSDCGFCLHVFPRQGEGDREDPPLEAAIGKDKVESCWRIMLFDAPGKKRKERRYEREP